MTSVPLSASAATVRPWWQRRPRLSTESLILLASGFFALACNGPFWHGAVATRPNDPAFTLVLLVLLVAVHALLLGLLLWGPLTRPLLSVLLLTTAGATYYMGRYGVYLDTDMLRNVLATDRKESSELITPTLLLALLGYAAVPIALLWRLRLRRVGFWRALWRRLLFLAALVLVIALTALAAGQGVASLLRNHREIRYLATPANYLVALAQAARSRPAAEGPKQPIGIDAHVDARPPGSRPRLLVIVLGETARARNWGLNGYRRQTTPELAALPAVINFPDMHACGTSTEVSVPCMFSPWGRHDYDEKKIRSHQSLLHVLDHAGIGVLWRDNQSGCKGVCAGLPSQSLADARDPILCRDGRCLDEILLQDLPAQVRARPGDRVLVLHQLGNHGPSYYQRYPPAYARFRPACEHPDLGRCRQAEIINAYDNALLYTDHVLARTIAVLQGMSDYDSALIYLSDHGESLGEKGLYLHGMPWRIAPAEQTRVPMVMWFSPAFARDRGLDLACLRARAGRRTDQDALFHSVLGLLQVRTALYQRERDLFADCIRARPRSDPSLPGRGPPT